MIKIICIIILILNLLMCYINVFKKKEKPKNKVHFYVARDLDDSLWLFIGKPFRKTITFYTPVPNCWVELKHRDVFKYFGLNENDYANLKWEDEPVEVFLNMKD